MRSQVKSFNVFILRDGERDPTARTKAPKENNLGRPKVNLYVRSPHTNWVVPKSKSPLSRLSLKLVCLRLWAVAVELASLLLLDVGAAWCFLSNLGSQAQRKQSSWDERSQPLGWGHQIDPSYFNFISAALPGTAFFNSHLCIYIFKLSLWLMLNQSEWESPTDRPSVWRETRARTWITLLNLGRGFGVQRERGAGTSAT